MTTYIAANRLPPVSDEFVAELRRRFRPRSIKPGTDRDEIMWDAGQQAMIDWIEQYAQGKKISGNPDDLHKPETHKPWWRRLMFWRSK